MCILRICTSNKLPGDSDAANPDTLRSILLELRVLKKGKGSLPIGRWQVEIGGHSD